MSEPLSLEEAKDHYFSILMEVIKGPDQDKTKLTAPKEKLEQSIQKIALHNNEPFESEALSDEVNSQLTDIFEKAAHYIEEHGGTKKDAQLEFLSELERDAFQLTEEINYSKSLRLL